MKENNKIYVHSGSKTFDKYIFHKISNREHWVKPMGGLWGSPLNSAYGWKQWCEDNNFNHTIGFDKYGDKNNEFLFRLKPNARLLYIDNSAQLLDLPTIDDELMSKTYTLLDFEKLEKEYDAIEVSISSDQQLYYDLYGWDVDSILVMNPDSIEIVDEGDIL